MVTRSVALVAAAAAVALAAGCAQSKVDPDAQVTVRGKLTLADGSPAANVKVGLMRVPDLGEVFFQGLVVAGSFGVACLSKRPPPICKIVQTAETDDKGEYVFRMRGSDVRGAFGQASYFHLGAAAPRQRGQRAGPSIDVSFLIQRENLTVPTMRFWQPKRLAAKAGPRHVRVDWSQMKDADDPHQIHFSVGDAGAAMVWRQAAEPGDRVDARAVADMRGAFHVTAHRDTSGPDTTFRTTYGSQRIGFRGHAGAPASRGAACAIRGERRATTLRPCPLTDGSYAESFPPRRCAAASPAATPSRSRCRANAWARVDLGSTRRIEAVFSHSLTLTSGEAVIQTSEDGRRWTRHGRVEGREFGSLSLRGVTARHVRVRSAADAGSVSRLHELSVWTK